MTSVEPTEPSKVGHCLASCSCIIPKLVNLTAELVACLLSTGSAPLHKAPKPSSRITSDITATIPLFAKRLLLFNAASSIILVFNASPGVTTSKDSATPALSPARMFTHGLRWPCCILSAFSRKSLDDSKVKKRMPLFSALLTASGGQPE